MAHLLSFRRRSSQLLPFPRQFGGRLTGKGTISRRLSSVCHTPEGPGPQASTWKNSLLARLQTFFVILGGVFVILGGVFVLYHSPTITSPQAKDGRGRVMTSFSRETSTAIVSGEVESCPIRDFRGRFRDFRGSFSYITVHLQ